MRINLISKIFDEAIVKCSTPKFFSKKVRGIFDKFAKETRNLDHEKAMYVTNNGEIIYEEEGDANTVHLDMSKAWSYCVLPPSEDYTDRQRGLFNELNIEHNHPTIRGIENFPPVLSMGDTDKLTSEVNGGYVFRSITAESNGKRMSLVRQYKVDYTYEMGNHYNLNERINTARKHMDNVIGEYLFMYRDKITSYTGLSRDELVSKLKSDESWGSDEYRDRITQQSLNDIGTLKDLLDKRGVTREFQDCDIEILLEE